MGSYLSTPVREKFSDDHIGNISYGSSSMQGWRASQEDAHNCQPNFDGETSLFAVYDGHGGSEVALYTAKNLPDFLKNLSLYKNGELHKALEEAFVGFDATLTDGAIIKQLRDIAGFEPNDDDADDDEAGDEAALLREEASIPIEKLIQRYKNGAASILTQQNEIQSPCIKAKKTESLISNGDEIQKEKLTNGSQEGSRVENSETLTITEVNKLEYEKEKNDESVQTPSASQDDNDHEPHCSKTEETEEQDDTDDDEDDDDDSSDKWNSDEESDEDDDDDDDDDPEKISISKFFQNEDEDSFGQLGYETPGSDSGCTAVVALMRGNDLYVANAGDSRCVVCRGQSAVDMSIDHKPEDDIEKERIYNAGGKITADGRVNGGLNLSRAIGDHAYKRNNRLDLKDQMITSQPDVKHLQLNQDDKFMVLACDGIWNVLTSQEVVEFVLKRLEAGETKLSTICEELFETCLAPDTSGDGTGCDNMTCIIVMFPDGLHKNQSLAADATTHEQVKSSLKRRRSEDETAAELPLKQSRKDEESDS